MKGTLQITPSVTNMKEICHDVKKLFSIQEKILNLNLIIHIDENIPNHMWSDPRRIMQIIINFMSNALKYTP